MRFEVRTIDPSVPVHGVFAVPGHEDGAFIIDHGPEYGPRVYDEMEVAVTREEKAQALAGDTSSIEGHFVPKPERPGLYDIVGEVGRVSIRLPHSGNTVSARVAEVLEVMPTTPVVADTDV